MRSQQATAAETGRSFSSVAGLTCLSVSLAIAPLLFGSVTTEAQGALGILLGLSLWFGSREWRQTTPVLPRWLLVVFIMGVVVSVIPLPAALLKFLSPHRADLASQFPLVAEPSGWTTLTISPALTLRWWWQWVLLAALFCLVRQTVRQKGTLPWLTGGLIAGIVGQVAAEICFGGARERLILGLWPVNWGNSAGTFANRNHFAGWLVLATLPLAALSVRSLNPLRSSRADGVPVPARNLWLAWSLLGVAGVGMVFALLSGSRSGLLALLAGALMLLVGLKRHSASRRRGFALLTLALLLMLALLPFSGRTLDRLSNTRDETSASYTKWRLWGDALTVSGKFPMTGSGPGTFVRGNILFKSTGGESTAWHAENDILQWLSEGGLWGLVVLGGGVFFFGRRVVGWFWSSGWKSHEPELAIGALAGLVAITVHSMFDFPWQVVANASLGVALLGILCGLRDATAPDAEFKLASRRRGWAVAGWGLMLAVVGVLPILASVEYRTALKRGTSPADAVVHLEKSLALWPLNTERANAWLRFKVEELRGVPLMKAQPEAEKVRARFTEYLELDPLNWELRLERAWLDLAFLKDRQAAVREASMATRLNPRQAMIPLRFAAVLATRDPEKAWEFLQAADVTQPRLLRERLEIAWVLRQDATELWSLVPATDDGYRALAEFALGKRLPTLALQAYEKMRLPLPAAERAEKLMQAGRADLALRMLPEDPRTAGDRLARAKAYLRTGDATRCLGLIEPMFQNGGANQEWQERVPVEGQPAVLLRVWKSGDRNRTLALQVAEILMREDAGKRDIGLLHDLSGSYPEEKRLHWLVYRTRMDRHEYREAAEAAVRLAEKLVAGK